MYRLVYTRQHGDDDPRIMIHEFKGKPCYISSDRSAEILVNYWNHQSKQWKYAIKELIHVDREVSRKACNAFHSAGILVFTAESVGQLS